MQQFLKIISYFYTKKVQCYFQADVKFFIIFFENTKCKSWQQNKKCKEKSEIHRRKVQKAGITGTLTWGESHLSSLTMIHSITDFRYIFIYWAFINAPKSLDQNRIEKNCQYTYKLYFFFIQNIFKYCSIDITFSVSFKLYGKTTASLMIGNFVTTLSTSVTSMRWPLIFSWLSWRPS